MTTSFGAVLKQLREQAGFSQADLAKRTGMNRFGIAKLEQGVRMPAWETVMVLCKALGVRCTEFEAAYNDSSQEPAEQPTAKPGRPRKAEEATEDKPRKRTKRGKE